MRMPRYVGKKGRNSQYGIELRARFGKRLRYDHLPRYVSHLGKGAEAVSIFARRNLFSTSSDGGVCPS